MVGGQVKLRSRTVGRAEMPLVFSLLRGAGTASLGAGAGAGTEEGQQPG